MTQIAVLLLVVMDPASADLPQPVPCLYTDQFVTLALPKFGIMRL